MTLRHNGRGRTYAICSGEGCDANVIDLPLDLECADRIIRTFFGWVSHAHNTHYCRGCRPAEPRRRGRPPRSRYNYGRMRGEQHGTAE